MNATAQMRISRSSTLGVLLACALLAASLLSGCGGDGTKPPQAPVVRLLSPNGGEQLTYGLTHPVTWTATDTDTPGASLVVALSLTYDNGSTWIPIATSETNDGQYQWTIPPLSTSQARIRVSANDGQATTTDESDANFTLIYNPPPPPERSTVSVGNGSGAPLSEVTVPLRLSNLDVAIDLETTLTFDENALEFVRGVAQGRGLAFPFTAAEVNPGEVRVRFQQQGVSQFAIDTTRVALLTFRLLGAGGSDESVTPGSTTLLDTNGDPLTVRNVAGTITILDVDTPASLTRDGWLLFEAGNYAGAKGKFDEAIVLDAEYGPAYTGRGWSVLQPAVTTTEFQAALTAFDAAIARQQGLGDARGGRAAALLALGGTQLAEAAAEAARAATPDPLFQFVHRTSFNFRDLYLIEAFAQSGRGRITEARDAADRITASGIRSGDPSTWRVDGVTYGTFEGAVLAFLQKMSNQYAG